MNGFIKFHQTIIIIDGIEIENEEELNCIFLQTLVWCFDFEPKSKHQTNTLAALILCVKKCIKYTNNDHYYRHHKIEPDNHN